MCERTMSIRFSLYRATPFAILIILTLAVAADAQTQPEQLTLDSLINLVAEHSREIKLAEQEVEYAKAEKKEALSLALPKLSAAAGYTRSLSDIYMYLDMGALGEDGVSKIKTNYDNDFSAGVVLQQTLFSFTVANALKAAKQYKKVTDYLYDASYQEIMTVTKQVFYQSLLLKTVWEVAGASEKNAHENFEDMQSRFDNGLVSEFELLQAEVRYRDAVPQTLEARRNYELGLVDIKNLAGIDMETDINLIGTLDAYPTIPPTASLDAILQQRPDYNALLWQQELYSTGVSAEKANYFPSLSAVAAYGYSAMSNEWAFENENNSWTVGLNLSIPIFTGGATKARVQKARVSLNKARLQLDRGRDNIAKEVKSVRLRLEEAHERITSARATMAAADKAFSIAEATAKTGLTTQLQLKDSRIALDQATNGYYAAVCEYLIAYYDWEKSIGQVKVAEVVSN